MPEITQLAFTTQPSDTEVNATILPEVRVELQDEAGDVVTTATNAVTVAIEDNPGAGVLSGTLTKNAVAGVAVFNNLKINQPGIDYTLRASAQVSSGLDPNDDGATLWLHGTDPGFTPFADGTVIGVSGVTPWPNRATAVGGTWIRASDRPSYRNVLGPNGQPYVEFGGPPSTEELNGFSEGVYYSASAYHFFAVVRPDAVNVALMFNGPETSLNVDASKFKFTHGPSSVTWGSDISVGTWYLVEVSFGAGTLSLRVNNGTPVTLPGVGNLGFGIASSMGIHGPCGIAEIIAFNVHLTNDVAAGYVTGLQTKYTL